MSQIIIFFKFKIVKLKTICIPSFSPIKFSGDCWPRGPTLPGSSTLQSPTELAMEVSTMDQMEVQASSEATAPLPIRQPAGSNVGQFKQQAYPRDLQKARASTYEPMTNSPT